MTLTDPNFLVWLPFGVTAFCMLVVLSGLADDVRILMKKI